MAERETTEAVGTLNVSTLNKMKGVVKCEGYQAEQNTKVPKCLLDTELIFCYNPTGLFLWHLLMNPGNFHDS